MAAAHVAGALAVLLPLVLPAQGPAPHPLGAIVATSTEKFEGIAQLRVLSDGRVLVNDRPAMRIVELDPQLTHPVIVLDPLPGKSNSFRTGDWLMPFAGDSSLVFTRILNAFVVIDPDGKITRDIAGPTGVRVKQQAGAVNDGPGTPNLPAVQNLIMTYSPGLGIIYNTRRTGIDQYPMQDVERPKEGEPDIVRKYEDSSVVIAINPVTRKTDTLLKVALGNQVIRTLGAQTNSGENPPAIVPFVDDVVITSDGAMAVFRSRDYRIDWVGVDGVRAQTPRIPFDWQRISDDVRSHLVDSVNTATNEAYQDALAQIAHDSAAIRAQARVQGVALPADAFVITKPPPIQPSEIPDFFAPTAKGSAIADAANHVWIRHITDPAAVDAIYDVIDRQGKLVDRVRIPSGESIVGFAPGFAFLVARDAGVSTLLKVSLR